KHVVDPFSKHSQPLNNNHSTEFCVPEFCVSVSLCDTSNGEQVLANIEAAKRRSEALKQRFPGLAKLYAKFIEPKFRAAVGHRNGFIVEAAPFIFRVVSAPIALQLLLFFYEMHRDLFKDSPEQHRYESKKMLESVAVSYRDGLNDIERRI